MKEKLGSQISIKGGARYFERVADIVDAEAFIPVHFFSSDNFRIIPREGRVAS